MVGLILLVNLIQLTQQRGHLQRPLSRNTMLSKCPDLSGLLDENCDCSSETLSIVVVTLTQIAIWQSATSSFSQEEGMKSAEELFLITHVERVLWEAKGRLCRNGDGLRSFQRKPLINIKVLTTRLDPVGLPQKRNVQGSVYANQFILVILQYLHISTNMLCIISTYLLSVKKVKNKGQGTLIWCLRKAYFLVCTW